MADTFREFGDFREFGSIAIRRDKITAIRKDAPYDGRPCVTVFVAGHYICIEADYETVRDWVLAGFVVSDTSA
jgi:hypothetical protein